MVMNAFLSKLETIEHELNLLLPGARILEMGAAGNSSRPYYLYLDRGKNRFLLFPQSALESPLVRRLAGTNVGHGFDPKTLQKSLENHPYHRILDVAVDLPASTGGALKNFWDDESLIVFSTGQRKRLAFVLKGPSHTAASVLKIPECAAVTENCMKEVSLLHHLKQQRAGIAPLPQAVGRLRTPRSPKQFLFTQQSFLVGVRPTGIDSQDLSNLLDALRLKDQYVSLRTLADEMVERLLKVDSVPVSTRDGLLTLLDLVADSEMRSASIMHGDLRASNFVNDSDGLLKAIDWEFCHRRGLAELDVATLMLDESFSDKQRASFSSLFPKERVELFARYVQSYSNQDDLPIGELLALHFVKYYLDRYLGFGNWKTHKLERLANALKSDWPFSDSFKAMKVAV